MYGDVQKSCRKNRWKEAFMNFFTTQGMNDTNHPSNRRSDEEKYLEKVEKWYKNPSKIVLTTVRINYGRWKRIAFLWVTEDTHRHFCFGRKGQEKSLGRATKLETRETGGSIKKCFICITKMADDRSPRRRKRTFSTTSTISTDDYQDASEQIVEDITLEFFYKPRSITALACLFVYLVYSAFTR